MNELLSPIDGATNLELIDGINEGFRCMRALTNTILPLTDSAVAAFSASRLVNSTTGARMPALGVAGE